MKEEYFNDVEIFQDVTDFKLIDKFNSNPNPGESDLENFCFTRLILLKQNYWSSGEQTNFITLPPHFHHH
jgi:hypothetical protein